MAKDKKIIAAGKFFYEFAICFQIILLSLLFEVGKSDVFSGIY